MVKEFASDHAIKEIYNRRRGTINKHLKRDKINKEAADAAKRYIEGLLDKAIIKNEYFLNGYTTDMEMDAVYKALGIVPKEKK